MAEENIWGGFFCEMTAGHCWWLPFQVVRCYPDSWLKTVQKALGRVATKSWLPSHTKSEQLLAGAAVLSGRPANLELLKVLLVLCGDGEVRLYMTQLNHGSSCPSPGTAFRVP